MQNTALEKAPQPLLLDMVHHNPGEAPFKTAYTDPSHLASLGYTGQVLKHLNACVPIGEFPSTPEEKQWLAQAQAARDAEIAAAKRANLAIYYHIDLFVLPKVVIESRKAELCDSNGRVCLTRPATLELHRQLLEAMFARFPDVDGIVTRVGETYLMDTPWHGGNTAVPLYDGTLTREEKTDRFIELLNFLREEVCVRHGRTLIHRTWDFAFHFHEDPAFYLKVTDNIEPHPRLIFSIKHTKGDFFRGCEPNPCIGLGKHPQIIEVQCAREYEGKGAYPSYIAHGVIDGFPEVPNPRGLRDWVKSPRFAGLWTWSRGGGWFGPYLPNELWPDLNTRMLAAWAHSPEKSESELFTQVCSSLGVKSGSQPEFRRLCLLAEEALWLGRSIPAYARLRKFQDVDCALLWMRDDRLGGLNQLEEIFSQLQTAGLLDEALGEKQRAAALYAQMPGIGNQVFFDNAATTQFVQTSCEYAARLFALIACGWELMIRRWRSGKGIPTAPVTPADLAHYQALLASYRDLPNTHPQCATLYQPVYWSWPGTPPAPGMDASVCNAPDVKESKGTV